MLLATISCPTDVLPLDLVLAHQLRAFGGGAALINAVVLNNQPPWLNTSERALATHEDMLRRIELQGLATVRVVDYGHFGDAHFLARFFEVAAAEPATMHTLLQAPPDEFGTPGPYVASNFFGMLHFLDACLAAFSGPFDMCIYVDPDVLIHKPADSREGLMELAASAFAANPRFVTLQPPTLCHAGGQAAGAEPHGVCPTRPWWWVSTRHAFFNCSRLKWSLPRRLRHEDFSTTFEKLWGSITATHGWVGLMQCGRAGFAIHPWSRFTSRAVGEAFGFESADAMEAHAHLAALASQSTATEQNLSTTIQMGTSILIGRIEAGLFEKPCQDIAQAYNVEDFGPLWGVQGCSGKPIAAMFCDDMFPSAARVRAGLAW